MFLRLQHHSRQTRIHRQLAQLAAQRRQLIGRRLFIGAYRAQLFQQTHAVLNVALIRRFDKRERGDIAQPQRRHLQNDRRQVGAQNFRVGKLRTRQEIIFRIKANTDAFGYAAAASFTLIGGRLRYGLNRQTLYFSAIAVAADTRRTRIDHIFDPRHRQRGFRHVGRQHNTPPAVRLEDAVLFAIRQSRIQRQHFRMAQIEFIQCVGGIADLTLTAHEDQNVAGAFTPQFIYCIENGLQLVAFGVIGLFDDRSIADFHRIRTPRDLNDRRIIEMARKTLRIDGRGGDDNFQIRTARQQFFQIAEQKIDVQTAFVRFIDNDGVILHQQTILLNFRQQDTVGHQLHHGVVADVIAKAHLITDASARLRLQLFRDTVRHRSCRQTTRLGVANQPFHSTPQFHTDFRELSGFT